SPFTPTPPPRRTWLRRAAIAVAAVLLVGVAVWVAPSVMCGGPGSDTSLVDGQCVGVTDGSFVFDRRFDEIQQRIKAENDRVAWQSKPSVKVALLTTLTPTEKSPMDTWRVRSSLEGAYVAQMRANHGVELGDQLPLTQLYLANEGSHQAQWEPVAQELVEMTEDEAPLVAVIGLGVSITATEEAAQYFSDRQIPMVSAVVTADGLDYNGFPGLLRASPSNSQYVDALDAYIDDQKDLESAILVNDSNDPDLFVATLREAYERELSGMFKDFPALPFRGSTLGETPRAGLFDAITRNICTADPDMVVYAGRTQDLHTFIDSLSVRVCRNDPLTVVFSVTGLSILKDEEALEKLKKGNVTLVYASATDPDWSENPDEAPEYFPAFLSAYTRFVGRDSDALDDGYAVMHHDAMATAVSAVRIAQPVEGEGLRPMDVYDALLLLHTAHPVPGASGTLSFTQEGNGNPGGKVIPVIEVRGPDEVKAVEGDPYVTPAE
ncbi:ABC transporter substrate-binding protein, partial [Nocardiopsis gilva]